MPVFYIDLDRTVFRTDQVHELFAAIERLYPANAAIKRGYDKRSAYYVFAHSAQGDDTTYYHDIVKQLRDAGLDVAEVFHKLRTELGDGRFEYEGLAECVRTLQRYGTVKLLTYGEDAYQRLKAALCPSLHGIEVITLIGSKGEYLARHASAGDWLLDDKRIIDAPAAINVVHIQHAEQAPADVHSLDEATEWIINRIDTKA